MTKRIALIDGYGFIFRAYHSLPPLSRNDGVPVGAVYGFTNMLIKLLAGLDVSHVAVVFDSGSKTFRNEIYPKYKANRPPCPEDLIPQFAIAREAVESLNLITLEKVGFEADDIIATIAVQAEKIDSDILIVSSDKDLMQLINGRVSMYDAMKNKIINSNEVKEKFFVEPEKVLDVLALMGDASDNIPGVRGIGPKTAAELINQFGNLENIFANLSQIKQDKRRQLLEDGVENARLSKVLASLKEDVELGISIEDLKIKPLDPHKLISFLEKQGFRSLITRVRKEFNIVEEINGGDVAVKNDNKSESANIDSYDKIAKIEIDSKEVIENIYNEAKNSGLVTIDYLAENNQLQFLTISSCGISDSLKKVFYFEPKNLTQNKIENHQVDLFNFDSNQGETNLKHLKSGEMDPVIRRGGKTNKPDDSHTQDVTPSHDGVLNSYPQHVTPSHDGVHFSAPTNDDIENLLIKILKDNSIKKNFFDAKNFLKIALKNFSDKDLIDGSYDDLSLINHLLNSSIKNDFRELININLDENLEEKGFDKIFAELDKKNHGKNFDLEIFLDQKKKIDFFAFRNFSLLQLYKILSPKIAELKLNFTYLTFERPLLPVLAQMEIDGIKIDAIKLQNLSQEFSTKIQTLTKEIYQITGEEFNIASTQQLSKILFEKLGLDSSKKSKKTGALSTKSSVLEELEEDGHEIARKILEFRKFSKLKNTYTDALPKEINSITKRIHSHFSTTSTITGRFNSSNPNLQNIPIKSIEGQKIRQAFIAEKNHVLISADYSQIELRVIAHVAKIDNLIKAFKDEKDIHRITASQVFGIPEEEIDDETRSKAKAINFGIIYGISAFGLAKQLNISRQEAAIYIKSYLEAYPGIDIYMKNYIQLARQFGYVTTISGRKCFIHDINNKNPMIRAEAERLAINAPIQGSAADIIKKAMINLSKKFRAEKLHSKIILQIHDELIIESPESEVELVEKILKSEMENAVMLDVPLRVDVKSGSSWR